MFIAFFTESSFKLNSTCFFPFVSLGLSQVVCVGVPLCWLKMASFNPKTDVQVLTQQGLIPWRNTDYIIKGISTPETRQASTFFSAWSVYQQRKLVVEWDDLLKISWPTLRLLPQLRRDWNLAVQTVVVNMHQIYCVSTYVKHMPMAQAAITGWPYSIHTHPSILWCCCRVGCSSGTASEQQKSWCSLNFFK